MQKGRNRPAQPQVSVADRGSARLRQRDVPSLLAPAIELMLMSTTPDKKKIVDFDNGGLLKKSVSFSTDRAWDEKR